MKRALLTMLAVLLWAVAASADETAIRAAECSKMHETNNSTNYGEEVLSEVGNFGVGDTQNPIMQFDISGVDGGHTISAATLWLFNIDEAQDVGVGGLDVEVAAVRRNWVELQVTWDDYVTSSAWTTGGAEDNANDRYAPEDTSTIGDDVDSCSWDVTDMVANWHNSTWTNNGLMLNPTPAPSEEYWRFHSDDAATEAYRPLLIITHAAAASGATLVVNGVLINKGILKVGD